MIDLVQGVRDGNRRALARLLTRVENRTDDATEALAELYPDTGQAWVIGVTGAPGTGKSSLVNAMTTAYRSQGKTVGVVAVDPTSPFSGGAILGDRIRMREHTGDAGVFIRSMATRGSLGGLATTTRDVIRVMDAAGFDVILVETVGAGQSEVDVVRLAHTTLVVEAPGLGDDIQAIKAGILEIADILVVNKADRPGAKGTTRVLKGMLELGHPASRLEMAHHHGQIMSVEPLPLADDSNMWVPPVIETVATDHSGIDALLSAIVDHRQTIEASGIGVMLERQRLSVELYDRLRDELITRLMAQISPDEVQRVIEQVQSRDLAPSDAIDAIFSQCQPLIKIPS